MNKKLLIQICIYVSIIGSWLAFCICYLEDIRAKQREKEMQKMENTTSEYIEIPTEEQTTEKVTEPIEEETTLIEEPTEPVPSYSKEDLILLAQLIESEGGIESYQCKLYIGSVVLNRVNHESFPNTLRGVIFQASSDGVHQFSVTYVRKDGTRAIDCTPSEESLKAAEYLLIHGTQLPPDILVFYADYCKEGWCTTRVTYTKVDTTVFAYIYSK